MNKALYLLPLVLSLNVAYAEPLDDIKTSVSKYNDTSATIKITWNHDQKVAKYETGCVSCIPNTREFTQDNSISLDNVTSLPNDSLAMLYIVAYDLENNIIAAKQIIVELRS
jgi:hypothetical protein